MTEKDMEFFKGVEVSFKEYSMAMERVEIKKALKIAMDISSQGNLYL